MQRDIVVLPDLFAEGWGGGDPSAATPYDRRTWAEFAAPHSTDAMACSYLIPGEDVQPRLLKGALGPLRDMGLEPGVHWVFLDLDRPGHEPWPSLVEAAGALYSLLPVLPNGAGGYTTRAGLRLVWHLDPPLPASLANSFLRQFGEQQAAQVVAQGLDIDPSSHEWTRLMRVPQARRDGQQLEAIIEEPGRSLDPYHYADTHGIILETSEQGSATVIMGDMPDGPLPMTFDEWKAAWAYPYLKVGGPIPEEGGHVYPVIQRILASIAKAGKITDPAKLISYVWESIEATPGKTPRDRDIWRLACWVASQEAASQEAAKDAPDGPPLSPPDPSQEEWLAVRAYFRGRDKRLYEKLLAGVRLNYSDDRLPETTFHVIQLLAGRANITSPRDIYAFLHRSVEAAAPKEPTPDQVWETIQEAVDMAAMGDDNEASRVMFCQDYPLTIKQVGKGGALFQLDTRTSPYRYRITDGQAVYLHFNEYTRPGLPFEAEYPTTMTLPQILALYGRTVERVSYKSGQDGTIYDRAGAYLSQGVHVLEATTARYHEDVDKYLRLLGASDVETFLDWCASLTYVPSDPVAALYLHGWGDGGKTLFAVICASLWGSGFVDYNQCQGDFNGALLANPVMLADEGIAQDSYNEDQASEKFRRYVANGQHPINAKFAQPADLFGFPRVIVTANGLDGIPFRKALGREGIDAITQRILYVRSDPAVRDFLKSLGGRAGLRDWVRGNGQPGKAAEHLLWLRDTRTLKTGGRFLVAGKMSPWHRQFVASQGYKPSVLAVTAGVARALESVGGHHTFVRPDQEAGVIWVHHSTVHDLWSKHADVRRPKPAIISETLDMLAGGEKKQKRFGDGGSTKKWCVPIPFQAFVDAKVLDWGDLGFDYPINNEYNNEAGTPGSEESA